MTPSSRMVVPRLGALIDRTPVSVEPEALIEHGAAQRRRRVGLTVASVAALILLVAAAASGLVGRILAGADADGLDVDAESVEVVGGVLVDDAHVSFVSYDSSAGRCLDFVVEYHGSSGMFGGCGGDGTSLREGGVGIGGVAIDGTNFVMINGRVDRMDGVALVEVDLADGRTLSMPVDAQGIFYQVLQVEHLEDPSVEPFPFRALSSDGRVLDIFEVPSH